MPVENTEYTVFIQEMYYNKMYINEELHNAAEESYVRWLYFIAE